jgi:hypothetical protein
MLHYGLRGFRLVLGTSILVVAAASTAFSACAAPAQSGLSLCFPSAGSTVLYPATIELAANSGGTEISHVSVYDGNTRVDDLDSLPANLIDYSITNGPHKITVNAWDANGKLYQAKSNFTVTGFGVGQCAKGSGTVTVCSPSQGSYQPEASVPISASFATGVKSWSMTLDGQTVITSAETGQSASAPILTDAFAAAGSHTLVIHAVDSKGVTSTLTRSFSTFYNLSCGPKSGACRPGIELIHPENAGTENAADVSATSLIQALVTGNPKPTTKMILYVDGVKKEQSAGPGLTADVTATKGTHYYVILAWDTVGKMYETYGNLDVQ